MCSSIWIEFTLWRINVAEDHWSKSYIFCFLFWPIGARTESIMISFLSLFYRGQTNFCLHRRREKAAWTVFFRFLSTRFDMGNKYSLHDENYDFLRSASMGFLRHIPAEMVNKQQVGKVYILVYKPWEQEQEMSGDPTYTEEKRAHHSIEKPIFMPALNRFVDHRWFVLVSLNQISFIHLTMFSIHENGQDCSEDR